MADKKPDDLESADTQEASPAKEKTPVKEAEEFVSKDVEKPAEGTEKERVSEKTQARIQRLIREKKALEAELEGQRSQRYIPKEEPSDSTPAPSTNELEAAVRKLKELPDGVVTKADLRAVQDRLYLEREHDRLRAKYDGSDGTPKYVSEEVEDYARSHYFGGNLEAAYKEMYEDERIDAAIRKRGLTKKTYTEKPTASVKIGEQPLTVATLRERLRRPDGPDWLAKNRDKIEPLLAQLSVK